MRLTVVVCVCDTEREYLENCLKSIRKSTLKDYELLVIDDGSSKDYTDIISKYEPRYVKTEKRGTFASRLYAISIANGSYITFVNSDDTVSFNYHMPMLEKAEVLDCDIVINDWAFHTEKARYFCVNDPLICENVALKDDNVIKAYASSEGRLLSYTALWNKVIKRSILLKAKGELESTDAIMHSHVYSESYILSFFAFKNARKVSNIHTGYYFYRVNESNNAMELDKDTLIKQINDMSIAFKIMLGSDAGKEIKESVQKWRELSSRVHYSCAKASKLTELYEYIRDSYKVDKLQSTTKKDTEAYGKIQLLGDNFMDIDKALRKIYFTESNVTVIYDKSDKYVDGTMKYIERRKHDVTENDRKTLMVPKKLISYKNRLLHNHFVYSMGMLLFKKGARAKLILK